MRLPTQSLPRDEPHLLKVASKCKEVYQDAHIEGGVMDTEVRFDALDHPNELLVTFRGSESAKDWLVNMCAMMVRYDGCMVHAGFLASWCSVDLQVVDAIDKYMRNTDLNLGGIVVAGHSLGSAMATLCAYDLTRVRPQYQVRLTTFAGPRVGDAAFANKIMKVNPLTIQHTGDIVPSVPKVSILARRRYKPCGLALYDAPRSYRNFVSKHRMTAYIETVERLVEAAKDD